MAPPFFREYDVPYNQRVCIDTGYRVGLWYRVSSIKGSPGCNFEKIERDDRLAEASSCTVHKSIFCIATSAFSKGMFVHIFIRWLVIFRVSHNPLLYHDELT